MAKTKTPFFSLGSQGTIDSVLTTQRRGDATMVRTKPIPAYRLTLPQQYQRWLYEDYAYRWTQQSEATQQEYRSAGVRFHLTGFQYWMKVMLLTMPDIVGWWALDEKAGPTARDFSPNTNHGIIIGATPFDGVIAGSYLFDGINDHIDVDPAPIQTFTALSVLCFTNLPAFDGASHRSVWWMTPAPFSGFQLIASSVANTINLILYNTVGLARGASTPYTPNTWEMHGCVWDGTTNWGIRNDQFANSSLIGGELYPNAPLNMGASMNMAAKEWYDGYVDNLIIFNRALDATEIARWSRRRYPA